MREPTNEPRAYSFRPEIVAIKRILLLLTVFLWTKGTILCEEAARLEIMVKALSGIENEAAQANILQGMLSGLAGRRNVPTPKSWPSLNAKLKDSESPKLRALAGFGQADSIDLQILTRIKLP